MRVTSVLQRVRRAVSAYAGSLPVLVVLALLAGVVGYFLLAPGGGTTPQAFDPGGRATASGQPSDTADQHTAPGGPASGAAEPGDDPVAGADDGSAGTGGDMGGRTDDGGKGGDGGLDAQGGGRGGKDRGPGIDLPSDLECLLQDPVPATLRLLTYNIHFGAGNLRQIARELRAWNADVILLQEVDRGRRGDQAAQLASWLGMEQVYAGLERKGRDRRRGNAILSRYPIVEHQVTALPYFPGPRANHRSLLRATVSVDGQLVDVFNTHLQHTSGWERDRQARVAGPIVTGSGRPTLLGGDFNARPGSPPYRQLLAGMHDLWRDVGGGPGHTSPNRNPNHRIDYLFRDSSITPREVAVMEAGISDHRAVRAVVDLPPDGPPCTEEE